MNLLAEVFSPGLGLSSNDVSRKIKESIWIGQQANPMNNDEGGAKLPRIYDLLFDAPLVGRNTVYQHCSAAAMNQKICELWDF